MSEDMIFCGVFDGHGPQGHLVARKVRDTLPVKLLSFLHSYESKRNGSAKACLKRNMKSDGGDSEKDISSEDKLNSTWKEAFMKAYKAMDKELSSHPKLDCFCSGSTSVTIVKQVLRRWSSIDTLVFFFLCGFLTFLSYQGSNLFMGYIGDSRAIMGSKDSNDSMVAIQLTVDLKPDLPSVSFFQ
jgi:serine/threonine protein phosphatase PrpC